MIRFLTAAFGEAYRVAALGLSRSFQAYSPEASLTIFTDLAVDFPFGTTVKMSFDSVIASLDPFYRNSEGQFRNVFRFQLFRQMQECYPGDDLCWIDADMLVLSDVGRHLKQGYINVMAHGRRDAQVLDCGGGLMVRGDRYAIGGMYSLPPGDSLEFLQRTVAELPGWPDGGGPLRSMADQLALNHLVARPGMPVSWITDDKRHIFNLEVSDSLHPIVGDKGLAKIRLVGRHLVRDERRIAVLCWIKSKFDAHLARNFSSFQPEVALFLRKLYV